MMQSYQIYKQYVRTQCETIPTPVNSPVSNRKKLVYTNPSHGDIPELELPNSILSGINKIRNTTRRTSFGDDATPGSKEDVIASK